MYCYYKCSVGLPHGAVDWSAVCECGNPDHTHLLFVDLINIVSLLSSHSGISATIRESTELSQADPNGFQVCVFVGLHSLISLPHGAMGWSAICE